MDVLFVNPNSSAQVYQELSKVFSAKQVLQFRDNAWHEYFTNPRYLDLVEKRFGVQQRKNIEEMSSINLKRKILRD